MTREELNYDKQKKIINEVYRENRKKIVLLILKVISMLIIVFSLFYLYNTYISTAKLIVKETKIINKKISTNFNGLKIIQFSDLHYGSNIFIDELEEVVKVINVRKPDVVIFTGDLIDSSYKLKNKEKEKLIKQLSSIKATLGKYAIKGDEDADSIESIFSQSDFLLLDNSYDLIYKGNDTPILIVGNSSMLKKNYDIDKAYNYFNEDTNNKDIYTISLMHEPDLVTEVLDKYKSDLILAGHSHNGNVGISFINKFKSIAGAEKYYKSFYKVGDADLYISSGIGTNGLGIRVLCQPSINFFRLTCD